MLQNVNNQITKVTCITDTMQLMTFVNWLNTELKKRNWNRAELARRTGFDPSAFTHIYSGRRKPGVDMCNAIAKVMEMPPEEVYRAAGLLDAIAEPDARQKRILHWLANPDLKSEDIDEIERFIQLKVRINAERNEQMAENKKDKRKPAVSG